MSPIKYRHHRLNKSKHHNIGTYRSSAAVSDLIDSLIFLFSRRNKVFKKLIFFVADPLSVVSLSHKIWLRSCFRFNLNYIGPNYSLLFNQYKQGTLSYNNAINSLKNSFEYSCNSFILNLSIS